MRTFPLSFMCVLTSACVCACAAVDIRR